MAADQATFENEKVEAFEYLIDTITNKKKHANYDRVVALAKTYKQLITGDKVDELLKQFVRREDDTQFDQRKRVTQAITPAVSSSVMNPFYKVGRVNAITKKITVGKGAELPTDLAIAIDKYNGDKSVDRYLDSRFVDLSFTDPNSFIITEFDPVPLGPQKQMTKKVEPRPFEVSCDKAINFFYKNSILQWLIVRLDCKYTNAETKKDVDGFAYTIYLPNVSIRFTQIDGRDKSYGAIPKGQLTAAIVMVGEGQVTKSFYRISDDELYSVEVFEHKAGRVQAFRIGYKRDLVTDGETYVNPMHDAMAYFMKSIKTVSEFDLTMALHAFPQKFQYVNRCVAEGCNAGAGPEGNACKSCGGSGWAIHKSAQDAVLMRMPKDAKDMFPLEQMVHYESPPIDILKFQDEFIMQLKNEARHAVFNSEVFSKTEVATTALEIKISMESVYDTLFPFAEQFSKAYKYIVTLIGVFTDHNDITVEHRFPKDFKFKSVSDLLGEQKTAYDSQAPSYIRQEISMDIAEQMFIDKPAELKRIRSKQRFFPFPDKIQTEIIYIISNGLTTDYNKTLWANFDNIFFQLETETTEVNFYDLEFSKQKEAIDKKVFEVMAKIAEGEPAPATGLPPDDSSVV